MENKELESAGSFKRSFANFIDVIIANLIRALLISLLFQLWIKEKLIDFIEEFKVTFQTDVVFFGSDPEKIRFLAHHSIFVNVLLSLIIIFIAGALYYILMNCSKWKATVGKKLMKLEIVKQNGNRLTFFESFSHYSLSMFPWLFVIYIFSYAMIKEINIYNAIMGNIFNLIFGLITVFWFEFHLITKRKITIPDLICKTKTVLVKN